jgi:raffinose/stachyose/melibiose transport system permease protein
MKDTMTTKVNRKYELGADRRQKVASMKAEQRFTNAVLYILLITMAIVWLMPFVIIVLTSVRSMGDLISNGVFAWPREIVLNNFERAWNIGNFSTYFRNSLLLIIFKVPLGIIIASLAAFPLAKMQFRFNNVIFVFFLIGLAIPIHVTLTPLLVMMKQLGIQGTLR